MRGLIDPDVGQTRRGRGGLDEEIGKTAEAVEERNRLINEIKEMQK